MPLNWEQNPIFRMSHSQRETVEIISSIFWDLECRGGGGWEMCCQEDEAFTYFYNLHREDQPFRGEKQGRGGAHVLATQADTPCHAGSWRATMTTAETQWTEECPGFPLVYPMSVRLSPDPSSGGAGVLSECSHIPVYLPHSLALSPSCATLFPCCFPM